MILIVSLLQYYEIISSEGDGLAFVDPFIIWSNEFTFISDQDKREKV